MIFKDILVLIADGKIYDGHAHFPGGVSWDDGSVIVSLGFRTRRGVNEREKASAILGKVELRFDHNNRLLADIDIEDKIVQEKLDGRVYYPVVGGIYRNLGSEVKIHTIGLFHDRENANLDKRIPGFIIPGKPEPAQHKHKFIHQKGGGAKCECGSFVSEQAIGLVGEDGRLIAGDEPFDSWEKTWEKALKDFPAPPLDLTQPRSVAVESSSDQLRLLWFIAALGSMIAGIGAVGIWHELRLLRQVLELMF